uniref:Uncharacterized protein LOC104248567 n=1 Tax=Nicotiana sylvestris TaxID=4096 RepID=A0A1U7YGB3_NICSY|nr:PREDICTED: uncharacterized protein LOC104248567 [Nicotiana sylvestris]
MKPLQTSVYAPWKAGSSGTIKLLDMPASPVIEEYQSEIITEGTQSVIEEGQVYQDKQTIATTIKHYSVMHKYQFKVKRSSHRSYWLIYVGENCNWYFKATSINDSAMFKTYPGSVVKLKKTADECFLYAFVALCTSISGWEYCRPVVVVDGTFLKSAYMGIMLIVSTMDAAGTILPLAYDVVDSEKDASWKWFLSNSSKHMVKELQSRSYTLDEFNERMSKIEEIDPRVKSYLYDIGYHKCSRVHATVNRTWNMTPNIAESLNAVIKDARELPIFDLLEYMRTLLERWMNKKLLKAKGTFTFLGSKFNKELENNRTLSQKLRRYIVCLESKKCSCGQFQLDELPCAHALAALRHRNETYKNYCSPYYTKESLLHTYEIPVNPLPDESK